MKCPHCHSMMSLYEKTISDKSQVAFYRCNLCIAEHVTSSMITENQKDRLSYHQQQLSAQSSNILANVLL